jgi:uncharacterized protein YndB with AHSA1/START domain
MSGADYADTSVALSIDHEDPAQLLLAGTGLTHLGSGRDKKKSLHDVGSHRPAASLGYRIERSAHSLSKAPGDSFMKITVETVVNAPVGKVWSAYTTPADIMKWNTASDDWHTTKSTVDLREGGVFSSRMEAKDGSFGFDFAGTYTKIVPEELIAYSFGDRTGKVEFIPGANGVTVRVTFDAETTHPEEQQRQGWQAILNNFAKHVVAQ